MNTKNLHRMPLHLAMFGLLAIFTFLPFSSLLFLKVDKNTALVLGTNSTVYENVNLTPINTNTVVNFKYNIAPNEIKIIKLKGVNIFLKQEYPGVIIRTLDDYTVELTNTTKNSYLIEGVSY